MFRRMIKGALGLVTGEARWWLLLVAAIAVAALYAWGAIGRADRDAMVAWGNTVCASAGRELQPAKGKRGEACATRIAALAAFERDTLKASNAVLADARARDQARATRDLALARDSLKRAADNLSNMEKADAAIGPDDHVSGSWFDALNRLGGLRAPGQPPATGGDRVPD